MAASTVESGRSDDAPPPEKVKPWLPVPEGGPDPRDNRCCRDGRSSSFDRPQPSVCCVHQDGEYPIDNSQACWNGITPQSVAYSGATGARRAGWT